MKDLRKYDIAILQLSNSQHEFDFEVDNDFFQLFDQDLIEKGNLKVHVQLAKNDTFFELKFKIVGNVELICDRSLEKFDHNLNLDRALIFKYGADDAELTEEILVISVDTAIINLAQFIFEFISLGIPMKKLHPKFDANEETEGKMVYTSDEGIHPDETHPAKQQDSDPRWDALKRLKQNREN